MKNNITTNEDFEESQKLIKNIFKNIEQRLPEQVFNQDYYNFLFEEFDWAMSGDFWNTIKRLAISSQDSYILTAVLEPSPTEYYFREFGYFNWLKLPIDISKEEYWKALESGPKRSPADAILHNSNVVVWISSSEKWAIWGERSLGICILAFKKGFIEKIDSSLLKSWRSVNEALDVFIRVNFKGKLVPKEISDLLQSNYSG